MTLAETSIHAQDPASLTPAMRQYQQYKQQYPDAILFFRIGDFYECFYEDARTVARVLSVALTSRSKGEGGVPMAGVPFHAVDTYLHRMIAAGFKVAICEQMESPKDAKGNGVGVIRREVTRLVTPGTLTEDAMLEGREENFIAAVVTHDTATRRHGDTAQNPESEVTASPRHPVSASAPSAAIAWCELSTGKFLTFAGTLAECREEIARLAPREILFAEAADKTVAGGGVPEWLLEMRTQTGLVLTARPGWQLDSHHALQTLKSHYGVAGFSGFGYDDAAPLALRPAGALIAYLHDTQKAALEHLQPPRAFIRSGFLTVDPVSLKSLEILRTMRGNGATGSLAHALDRTHTPMGARLFKNWLCYPLCDRKQIERRHSAIETLLAHEQMLGELRRELESCSDIERITARICCRRATPRDLIALTRSLDAAISAGEQIKNQKSKIEIAFTGLEALLPAAREITQAIRQALQDEPPAHLRDGGVIREAKDAELDRLRALSQNSRTFLAEYQARLIASSGISSLKVGYNKIFGFYIEVTHAHAAKIPANFVRKQTVKSAERYITPELKQYEADILTAQERALALEQELFEALRAQLAGRVDALQKLAAAVAELDVLSALAHLARERRYVRPVMSDEKILLIREGRHPVVEQMLGEQFVPNDTAFGENAVASGQLPVASDEPPEKNTSENQKPEIEKVLTTDHRPLTTSSLHLITGPNMAGKSTYIRQVALLVLMAQAGSFVPAASATIGIVDRIFTRVGAADDLAGGQSTFMVEMTETANILHHATERSLVILDEIGRGTSTLDGLALAWAIAEYLAFTARCRTLFATHYHELTELAETGASHGHPGAVANFNVLVREWEEQIVFMHRIAAGAADKSYGVHVARLAGVPRSVITRAKALMGQLVVHVSKGPGGKAKSSPAPAQAGIFDSPSQQALGQLKNLDLDRLSPMQAWEMLRALQQELTKPRK